DRPSRTAPHVRRAGPARRRRVPVASAGNRRRAHHGDRDLRGGGAAAARGGVLRAPGAARRLDRERVPGAGTADVRPRPVRAAGWGGGDSRGRRAGLAADAAGVPPGGAHPVPRGWPGRLTRLRPPRVHSTTGDHDTWSTSRALLTAASLSVTGL